MFSIFIFDLLEKIRFFSTAKAENWESL